jgi:hypothetical protein
VDLCGAPGFIAVAEIFFKLNKCFTTKHDHTPCYYSIIASKGNEYLAVLTANPQIPNRISIDIYQTDTTSFTLARSTEIRLQPPTSVNEDSSELQGTILTDGQRALVFLQESIYDTLCFCTSDGGTTWTPFSLKGTSRDLRFFASDDERVFFRRGGKVFGKGGQVVVIDAYSAETWNYARSWSFGMGDGMMQQNVSLLPTSGSSVGKPILVAISTYLGFGYTPPPRNRCIVCSSTGQQYYLDGLEYEPVAGRTWVSSDNRYLVHRTGDTERADLLLWDMTRPTFRPLAQIPLPDVQEANRTAGGLQWIPAQTSTCRFSRGGEVMTIAVANHRGVVVSSYLTFSCQLVYHVVSAYITSLSDDFVPLQVCIDSTRGVSVVGGKPKRIANEKIYGLSLSFEQVHHIYEEIIAVEQYFDTIEMSIRRVTVCSLAQIPLHHWRVSNTRATGRPRAIKFHGETRQILTPLEAAIRTVLFNVAFRGRILPLQWMEDCIIHLVTVNYPWDPTTQVILFLLCFKFNYAVIASALQGEVYVTQRALYVSDTYSDSEILEIYEEANSQFILKVRTESNFHSFSGFPSPTHL